MSRKTLFHPDLADDLDILLDELRDNWEFCAGVKGAELVKEGKMLTSKVFTETVILAEGMKLEDETNWIRRIKRRFVQRYGHEVSERTWKV
jgi:hypothetical protein